MANDPVEVKVFLCEQCGEWWGGRIHFHRCERWYKQWRPDALPEVQCILRTGHSAMHESAGGTQWHPLSENDSPAGRRNDD